MVLAQINRLDEAYNLLKSAFTLAGNLKKEFGVLWYAETLEEVDIQQIQIQEYLTDNHLQDAAVFVRKGSVKQLTDDCEELEASFLLIQLLDNKRKSIQNLLNACRELRIPYVFFKSEFSGLNLDKVMLPVGFLVEEVEKAQFASAFGRFCQSTVQMLLANDYGSKAATNAEKMKLVFDKFDFSYSLEKAKKDSFKVEKEAVERAETENYGIVIISASRDYGLDDILFGPKELHLVKNSTVPLLLVNPRGDLYVLCD